MRVELSILNEGELSNAAANPAYGIFFLDCFLGSLLSSSDEVGVEWCNSSMETFEKVFLLIFFSLAF